MAEAASAAPRKEAPATRVEMDGWTKFEIADVGAGERAEELGRAAALTAALRQGLVRVSGCPVWLEPMVWPLTRALPLPSVRTRPWDVRTRYYAVPIRPGLGEVPIVLHYASIDSYTNFSVVTLVPGSRDGFPGGVEYRFPVYEVKVSSLLFAGDPADAAVRPRTRLRDVWLPTESLAPEARLTEVSTDGMGLVLNMLLPLEAASAAPGQFVKPGGIGSSRYAAESSVTGWTRRAIALAREGRHEGAVQRLDAAILLNANDLPVTDSLTRVYTHPEEARRGFRYFAAQVATHPEDSALAYKFAEYCGLFGLESDCAGFWREQLALGRESAQVHYHLGLALGAAGLAEEALAAYRRAVVLDPGHAAASDAVRQFESGSGPE